MRSRMQKDFNRRIKELLEQSDQTMAEMNAQEYSQILHGPTGYTGGIRMVKESEDRGDPEQVEREVRRRKGNLRKSRIGTS